MYSVIYKFEVKQSKTEQFVTAWLGLTKLIYQYEGSLGSRLHKLSDTQYMAYAQWPSKQIFDTAGSNMPTKKADEYRKNMKDTCTKTERLYEMEMVEDYLQPQECK